MAVVAVALAAAIIAISQQIGTDSPQTVSAPTQATTEAAAPSANANGLDDALASGKLDAGFGPTDAATSAAATPAPTTVEVAGQGSSYDALIAGKFGEDFGPNANVRYVRGPGSASGGLRQELASIGFDAAPVNSPTANTPAPRIVELSGQGGLHDALISGKLTMDSNVQYVAAAETTPSGTVQAWNDGKFDESATDTQPSPASTHSPAISGGYQE
jgi:hypothetical protein